MFYLFICCGFDESKLVQEAIRLLSGRFFFPYLTLIIVVVVLSYLEHI